jgi:hypothetical protein
VTNVRTTSSLRSALLESPPSRLDGLRRLGHHAEGLAVSAGDTAIKGERHLLQQRQGLEWGQRQSSRRRVVGEDRGHERGRLATDVSETKPYVSLERRLVHVGGEANLENRARMEIPSAGQRCDGSDLGGRSASPPAGGSLLPFGLRRGWVEGRLDDVFRQDHESSVPPPALAGGLHRVVEKGASGLHSLKEQQCQVGSGGRGCDERDGVGLVPKKVHFVERSAAGVELSPDQYLALVEPAGITVELRDRNLNRLLAAGGR